MSDIIVNLDINNTGFNIKIRNAERMLNQLTRGFGRYDSAARQSAKANTSLLDSLSKASIIGFAAQSMFDGLRSVLGDWKESIIASNAEMEKMTALLGGLSDAQTEFGKNRAAHESLKSIIQLAKEVPFSMNELTKSFVKFNAVGLADPERMLRALADAVANFGGSEDELHRASVAIQQMAGKGVISMEELRQQLGEAVPNAISVMAKELGYTYAELVEVVSSGQLDAYTGLTAFMEGSEKKFKGSAQRIMSTWSGMMSVIKTNWMLVEKEIGQGGFFYAAKEGLSQINELIQDPEFKLFAFEIGRSLGNAVEKLLEMAKALYDNRDQVVKIMDATASFFTVVASSKAIQWTYKALMALKSPIGALITLLGGAAAAWGYLGDATDDAGRHIGIFDRAARDLQDAFQTGALSGFSVAIKGMQQDWDKFMDAMNKGELEKSGVKEYFSEVEKGINAMDGSLKTYMDTLGQYEKKNRGFIANWTFSTATLIATWVESAKKAIEDSGKKAIATGSLSQGQLGAAQDLSQFFKSNEDIKAWRNELNAASLELDNFFTKANNDIAKAQELREKLDMRWNETGGNWSENDLIDKESYDKYVGATKNYYQQINDKIALIEKKRIDIIRESGILELQSRRETNQAILEDAEATIARISEAYRQQTAAISAEIQNIQAQITSESSKASPDLSVVESLKRKLDELTLSSQSATQEFESSVRAAREQADAAREQLGASEPLGESFEQAKEKLKLLNGELGNHRREAAQVGTALVGLRREWELNGEKIKELPKEIKSAQQQYDQFLSKTDGLLRDVTPGTKEIRSLQEYVTSYTSLLPAFDLLVEKSKEFDLQIGENEVSSLHNSFKDALASEIKSYYEATEAHSDYRNELVGELDDLEDLTGKRFDMIKIIDLETAAYKRRREEQKRVIDEATASSKFTQLGYEADYATGVVTQRSSGLSGISAESLGSSKSEFLKAVYDVAYSLTKNIEESALIAAQAALETGYGKHVPNNNLFGIKGGSGSYKTKEFVNGKWVTESAAFKGFQSWQDSVAARVEWTQPTKNPRYAKAGYLDAQTAESKADALQKAEYGTDPNYAAKIKAIIPAVKELKGVNNEVTVSQNSVNEALKAGSSAIYGQASAVEKQVEANNWHVESEKTLADLLARKQELLDRARQAANGYDDTYSKLLDLEKKSVEQGKLTNEQELEKYQLQQDLAQFDETRKSAMAEVNAISEEAAEIQARQIANGEQYVKIVELQTLTEEQRQQVLDGMSDSFDTLDSASRQYNDTVATLNTLLAYGRISMKEYAREMENAEQTLRSAQGPFQAWIVDLEKQIPNFEEFTVDVMDSFVDTLVDGLSEGKLEFSDFVDDVKKMLARIAINKIVVSVLGNVGLTGGVASGYSGVSGAIGSTIGGIANIGSTISGLSSIGNLTSLTKLGSAWSWLGSNSIGTTAGRVVSGLGAGASGPLTQTGTTLAGVSNLSYLSGMGLGGFGGYFLGSSLFDGDYVDIGAGLGSAGGAALGATYGSIIPGVGTVIGGILGGLLGGTGGGFLGSLFGSSEPEFGGYQMSFSGLGFEENVKSKGAFGLSFGATGTGTHNMDMSEYQDIFDGFAGMTNVLADFYGSDLEAQVKNAIWSQIGDYKKLSKDTSEALDQVFTMISEEAVKAEQDLDGPAHALNAVIEASGGLTALGDSAEDMTKVIQGGIEIATYSAKLFNTEIGKLMGMGLDREFDSVVDSAKAMTWYVQAFWKEGETSASMIERFVTNLDLLNTVVLLTNNNLDGTITLLEDLGYSALNLMIISEDFRDKLDESGTSVEEFSTLLSNYMSAAYTDAERAKLTIAQATRAIADWNAEMGLTGDAAINSLADFREFIEGMNEASVGYSQAVIDAITEISDWFVKLDEALKVEEDDPVQDFIDSITPSEVRLQEFVDLFSEWGIELPTTSEALYEMIKANKLSTEQIKYLVDHQDELSDAWSAIADVQDDLIDKLTDAYNDAVDVAQERSDALIEQMREQSEAYLDALEKEYNLKVDTINETLDMLEEWQDVVASVSDALESLTQQLEGSSPDMTRQRYLALAEDAIKQYQSTGELPNNIQDIISALSQVEQQDFASFADWEAAIGQNMDVLNRLVELSGYANEDELQDQIDYWEKQLELEQDLYEQAKEDEEDRLDRAIEAEEDRLERELAALEDEFDKTKLSIENASLEELMEMAKQTDWLEAIFKAILDANAPGTPDEPGTGAGAEIWNDLPGGTPESERGKIWQQIQDIISGGGLETLPMPEIGSPEDNFKDAYDKLSRLLKNWKGLGLVSDAERQSVIDLLEGLGITVPGFATGGVHTGGLRIVGERGPELEYTGPSSIAANNSIDSIFKAGNADLADEIRALRSEVQSLKTVAMSQATSSAELTRIHKRWDGGGLPPDRMDYLKTLADEAVSA